MATIHVAPDDTFDDWVIRDEAGRVLGHFPTREAAELAAEPVARAGGNDLVIHLPDGRSEHKNLGKS
jgi:hypothetical protein